MDINPKAKGRSHHRNKSRYKDKSKIVTQNTSDTKTKSESRLGSNWDRYNEDPEESNSSYYSTDFSLLAQAPISHGGHFQFKRDKNVTSDADIESIRKNKVFNINIGALQNSLSTIPFHERCEINEAYFNAEELKEINQRACENKLNYENYLKLNSLAKGFINQSIKDEDNSESSDEEIHQRGTADNKQNAVSSQTVKEPLEIKSDVTDVAVKENEDLEDWLDDILDD